MKFLLAVTVYMKAGGVVPATSWRVGGSNSFGDKGLLFYKEFRPILGPIFTGGKSAKA
jgi:hypothetical protein